MAKLKKALPWICLALALLAFAGALVFKFGGMMPPSAEAKAIYARDVAEGLQPPLEKRFVIPIPGCVCHSTDPTSQVRHSVRRLSECKNCHG